VTGKTVVLAVDPGETRIGLALSDPERRFALPLAVVERRGDYLAEIAKVVVERQVGEIVVGLPRSLKMKETASTKRAREMARQIHQACGVEVHLLDERLSSVQAQRSLADAGHSRRSSKGKTDQVAATIILQNFLDGAR